VLVTVGSGVLVWVGTVVLVGVLVLVGVRVTVGVLVGVLVGVGVGVKVGSTNPVRVGAKVEEGRKANGVEVGSAVGPLTVGSERRVGVMLGTNTVGMSVG
jgi:hypothetical protein